MKSVPLVLIHGYPFDHTMWFSTIASIGTNARVLAPDLPGFGRNPLPSGAKVSLEEMADSVAGLLDANRHHRAVVAGMSMGGYVALAFAERYPQRLCGLGIVSSQPQADTSEARQGRELMIHKIRDQGPEAALNAILPKLFSESKAGVPELTDYARKGAQAAGVNGLCAALVAMAERPDRTGVLRELNVPVLVVHGTDDKIVPVDKARDFVESCQKPLFVELRGVGHASPLEAPDDVAQALIRLMQLCAEGAGDAAMNAAGADARQ